MTAYLEEKFCINSFLSNLIFEDPVDFWDEENVHVLLQISCDSKLIQQICALVKIQNDLGIWDTQKKYHIKNKINKLLQERIPEKVDCMNLRDDDLHQIDTIDPTYVGMNLTSKLLVRGGFLGVSIAGVLLSRKTVSPQLSKILLGVSASTIVITSFINLVNAYKDETNHLEQRLENLKKIKGLVQERKNKYKRECSYYDKN